MSPGVSESGPTPTCTAVYELPVPSEAEQELFRIFGDTPAYYGKRECLREPGHTGSHISHVGSASGTQEDDLFVTVWNDDELFTVSVSGGGSVTCWPGSGTDERTLKP